MGMGGGGGGGGKISGMTAQIILEHYLNGINAQRGFTVGTRDAPRAWGRVLDKL